MNDNALGNLSSAELQWSILQNFQRNKLDSLT
jgi:hypothetical protein